MIWPDTHRLALTFRITIVRLALALALLIPACVAQAESEPPQAWLVTYGPGEVYWQRFGHNAIWIRDERLGLDHTFNFGFFDFAQERFLRNFLLGRLNYFAAARPAQVEFAEYIDQNRSIRAQKLELDPQEQALLTGHLLNQVSPDNREYLYDYYRHNCSTRIRDAVDLALGGALRGVFDPQAAPLNYRDHTRRLTSMDYWLYLGLQSGLGSPVDRPISRYDETFIPGVLAQAVQELPHPRTGRLLVSEDVMIHQSTLASPPAQPPSQWKRYLLIPTVVLTLAFLTLLAWPRVTPAHLAIYWLVVAGLAGAVLAFFWWFTDHWVTVSNINLLLLNPLWLLIAAIPTLHRPGAWLIALAGTLALFSPWLPPGQYNAEVVALALPLNLAAALALWRHPQMRN